jgi:hypothetical protein
MVSNARFPCLVPAAAQLLLNILERDVASRVLHQKSGSQQSKPEIGRSVAMFRVNYMRPEQMPPHQRDFPRRDQPPEVPGAAGSRALVLMVALYFVAMFAGILFI